MANEIEQSIQQKARELAHQITVAHDLDPEIQEELYGHIEDKLLAYKSGEERISDEDAFILVREHFGDAKVIRGLLQEVHAGAVQVTLVRRVLALVLVLLAAGWVSAGLSALAHMVSVPYFDLNGLPSTFRFQLCVVYPLSLGMLLGTFAVLRRWKRHMRLGKSPWFCRWSIFRMVQWIVVLMILRGAMPYFVFSSPTSPNPISYLEWGLLYGYGVINLVGYCVLWLWWTDVLAGRWVRQLLVGSMWVFYSLLVSLFPVGLIIQLGSALKLPDGMHPIADFQLGNVEVAPYLFYLIKWPGLLRFSFMSPLIHALCMFLCVVVLQLAYHPWHKKTETNSVSSLPW